MYSGTKNLPNISVVKAEWVRWVHCIKSSQLKSSCGHENLRIKNNLERDTMAVWKLA